MKTTNNINSIKRIITQSIKEKKDSLITIRKKYKVKEDFIYDNILLLSKSKVINFMKISTSIDIDSIKKKKDLDKISLLYIDFLKDYILDIKDTLIDTKRIEEDKKVREEVDKDFKEFGILYDTIAKSVKKYNNDISFENVFTRFKLEIIKSDGSVYTYNCKDLEEMEEIVELENKARIKIKSRKRYYIKD